jgi:hypothetical protein
MEEPRRYSPTEQGRRLYKRLIIAFHDLTESRQFLNRLLGLNSEIPPPPSDKIQREALMTALIVSYVRSFSKNRDADDVLRRLPEDFLCDFTETEKQLHARMLQLRDQEFAHSDPEKSGVTVRIDSLPEGRPIAWPVSTVVRQGLTAAELNTLNGMFSKLLTRLMAEFGRIGDMQNPGESF